MNDFISFIPLGGIGTVTKNMYLYGYRDEILIVDCGLGFADETMLGVDLLLPDTSYLRKTKNKIVGMVLSHGHEDHIGALPFLLPQLPPFPIYASPLTAALANEKIKEFGIVGRKVNTVNFSDAPIKLGNFTFSFARVTHSVPDTSNIFIKTPVVNFYHGSDFKIDDTPSDGKKTDYEKITKFGNEGVYCLMSDCLGAEKDGRTGSDINLLDNFLEEMKKCKGKFLVTTYSSNIARLNQIIKASEMVGRKVCFIGRSLTKVKDVATRLDYMQLKQGIEVELDQIKNYNDSKLTFIVAGSQAQEYSALFRVAYGLQKEVKLKEDDTVIFSADPIPGNETSIYELIDEIAKSGARVIYSRVSNKFHVSGHGSKEELKQMISMVKPKKLLPIGGALRHMFIYRDLAESLGYKKNDVLLMENGKEVIFRTNGVTLGRTISIEKVYVDEISGEKIDSFVLRDRQKLSEGGIVTLIVEIDSSNGRIVGKPEIIIRGFVSSYDINRLNAKLLNDLHKVLSGKKTQVINWIYIRKLIGETAERRIFKELRRRPLILPIVLEV